MVRYKINKQDSIVFLYISKLKYLIKIIERIFTIVTKM